MDLGLVLYCRKMRPRRSMALPVALAQHSGNFSNLLTLPVVINSLIIIHTMWRKKEKKKRERKKEKRLWENNRNSAKEDSKCSMFV